jgi:hypothetical protein
MPYLCKSAEKRADSHRYLEKPEKHRLFHISHRLGKLVVFYVFIEICWMKRLYFNLIETDRAVTAGFTQTGRPEIVRKMAAPIQRT